MIGSFFIKFYAKHHKFLYTCFCVFWVISLPFYFAVKDAYNTRQFLTVAKIGNTWKEVNDKYDISTIYFKSIDETTLIRDTWLCSRSGVCLLKDSLSVCRMPKETDDSKTVREFFPNTSKILFVCTILTSGVLLFFDDNDRIIAQVLFST